MMIYPRSTRIWMGSRNLPFGHIPRTRNSSLWFVACISFLPSTSMWIY